MTEPVNDSRTTSPREFGRLLSPEEAAFLEACLLDTAPVVVTGKIPSQKPPSKTPRSE